MSSLTAATMPTRWWPLWPRGTCAVTPPRRQPCAYDPVHYAQRQSVEQLFSLK